jgi:4-diphosphocytidyl-2-C-methyl-D-erythritol kinase
LTGPNSGGVPQGDDNLVMRAARLVAGAGTGTGDPGAALVLEKHLPPASGIGGGSSDAAAAMRAVSTLWGHPLPLPADVLRLGADVPACLVARPLRLRGIGDRLDPLPDLPDFALVLANPRIETPTPAVFAALTHKENAALPDPLPTLQDARALAVFLHTQRNDLEGPARALCPPIGDVLAALAALPGCHLARMSGSGATCFGLFDSRAAAGAAARTLATARPGWWVAAGAPWALSPHG